MHPRPPVVRPRHVYVHVPFCARRCSYCDFAIAVRRDIPWREYADALDRELRLRFGESGAWPVDTLYLGGGTPSRLGAAGVAAVFDVLRAYIAFDATTEVTLETNPDDVSAAAIDAWRGAGVNRLSIGAQSFDEETLKWMHRTHDAEAVGRAVDAAREGGITNVSLDLIFALPDRGAPTTRSWQRDVELALALEPSHLSLYGLTIEAHTPLGRWHDRGEIVESAEERYEDEFMRAHEMLSVAGLEHYEVSNFGRQGCRSRHNSSYWSGAAYAGLGPSAHEFDGASRRWNVAAYAAWRDRLATGTDPIADQETLTQSNRDAESVYLGLRTLDGLALREGELPHVKPWIDAGWARTADNERLVLTPAGWLRLDSLAAALTLVRSHY